MIITSTSAKSARLELGISQNKVAKDTGLSRPYLSNFELGKYNPDDEFKETLKSYYIKEGVIFDNKTDEVESTTKPDIIQGILVNTDHISLNKAKEYAEQLNTFNADLLKLNNDVLPVSKGVLFDSIDIEAIEALVNNNIKKMAISYLKVLEIQGNNPMSTKLIELPDIHDLVPENSNDYSVGDYIAKKLSDGEDKNKKWWYLD
jgi:transcriptional regulator with XRE-family HTH domain